MNAAEKLEVATLGGGCFWCLEAALLQLRGVETVVSGYAGGAAEPDYHSVCSGRTDHAEVVEVRFDPDRHRLPHAAAGLLRHPRPDHPNRQGNDIGTQYRSVIFTHGDEQEKSPGR
jgi:methionine-S-sulfoxide reductase